MYQIVDKTIPLVNYQKLKNGAKRFNEEIIIQNDYQKDLRVRLIIEFNSEGVSIYYCGFTGNEKEYLYYSIILVKELLQEKIADIVDIIIRKLFIDNNYKDMGFSELLDLTREDIKSIEKQVGTNDFEIKIETPFWADKIKNQILIVSNDKQYIYRNNILLREV